MAEVATTIKVKYSCACDRCGTVNVEETRDMDQDFFSENAKSNPEGFWKEDKGGQTVYRVHEESSDGRCPRSC